jgi:hypothetical protein
MLTNQSTTVVGTNKMRLSVTVAPTRRHQPLSSPCERATRTGSSIADPQTGQNGPFDSLPQLGQYTSPFWPMADGRVTDSDS